MAHLPDDSPTIMIRIAEAACDSCGLCVDFYPVESFFRMARRGRIASGTSEVMPYIVQRDLYKEVLGRKQPLYEAL